MKSRKGNWGELFDMDDELEMEVLNLNENAEEAILFLEEAHEALTKLNQKTNKRGGLMKQPRRAESWD